MPETQPPLDYFGPKSAKASEPPFFPRPRTVAGKFIVVLLLLLLAAFVASLFVHINISGEPSPKIESTKASLETLKQALSNFETDHDRFPTTAEGLDGLVHRPPGMSDWHPHLEKIPLDAWGHPFVYRNPTTTGQQFYDLYSLGPDGQDGTPDDIWE